MANNLKAIAQQAGLTEQQKKQIDGLSKLVDSHQTLMNMPEEQAKQSFAQKPAEQQKAHTAFFGSDNPLGNALHYATSAAKTAIATPFKILNEISDFTTRLYRTGAIAFDQGVDLGKAFEIANDKGDNVFSPGRIAEAEKKFGKDMMSVAMKVASGQSTASIIANGTEAEKEIASRAQQLQEKGQDYLFQDALDAAQAAKYSPGRQLANLLLPGSMEGSGFLYKGISGVTDAAFRIFADPTLQLGKAKKAYDAGNWMLYNIIGKEKYTYGRAVAGVANNEQQINRVFANPKVTNFFDVYGQGLDDLSKARKASDYKAAAEASTKLTRLAPEFGPAMQDELIRAGVKNADTAKTYLQNIDETSQIFKGQPGRRTALIPQLDAARKARVNFLTTADRVFNIDKVGQQLVKDFYGLDPKAEDIIQGLTQKIEKISAGEKGVAKFRQDGAFRFTNDQIRARVDRFAQKFATQPFFKGDFFEFNSPDAADKIYQLSRLGMSRYHARIIKEAFAAGNEGQKRQIYKGIWDTLGEIKGWNKSEYGQDVLTKQFTKPKQYAPSIAKIKKDPVTGEPVINPNTGEFEKEYFNPAAIGPNGEQMAIMDWQLSSGIRVPNIMKLNQAVAKNAFLARRFGINYKQWIENANTYWTFGTLAGPRTVLRNAGEDLLMHGLIGESPLAVVTGRTILGKLKNADPEAKASMVSKIASKLNRKEVAAKLDSAIAEGDLNKFQAVSAAQLIKNSLGKWLDDDTYALIERHYATGGDKAGINAIVSEGANNSLRGSSQSSIITEDISKYGARAEAIKMDEILYKEATGVPITNINPVVSPQNRVSWLFTIGVNASSDLGGLAFKYMKPGIEEETRKRIAVNAIRDYLDNLPPKAYNRFELRNAGVDSQTHAEAIYDSIRAIVSRKDGSLNDELVNKIRQVDAKGNVTVNAKMLGLDDLPGVEDFANAPEWISGPTFIPVAKDFTSSIISGGYDMMGKANAYLTRQPLVQYELGRTLKTFEESGFRERFIARATKGLTGDSLELATKNAEKQLAVMAEEVASTRVLAFVDNPEIRSQLAMNIRNFARFYRATEDFYRRAVRSIRYNPESLARASLTYEGIAHSGWVKTDENGDQYFFYPGLSPVYRVMDKVANIFGVKNGFQTGIPVEFGAKLKMITPSMNPDSLFPTFAGPVAALPIKMIGNVIPQFKDLEQYLTGNYGQDQPMISAVLPAHLNRFLATLNTDERSSQFASAGRKAATYLEATGHGIGTKIDPKTGQEIPPTAGEIADYQEKLQGAATTILALRFIFGFFAPASPSVNLKSNMAQWARDNGEVSFKSTFNKLIEAHHGDIDKATQDWIKYYPDQMPYTVSESDSNVVANVRAVDKATTWVDQNQALLQKYPEAAAFLIPQAGKFDFNAYRLLFKSGLKTNKTLTDFVRQVSVAKDREEYYTKKAEYDQMLAYATDTNLKRSIRDEFQAWADEFKGARPLLQIELAKGSASQLQRTQALDDLRKMLDDKSVTTEPNTRKTLRRMLDEYDNYVAMRDFAAQPGSGYSQDYKTNLQVNALANIKSMASGNPNAEAAYNSLFAPLFR